jgi:anti-sigma B factor antagonist
MSLSVESRACGSVYVIRCSGRIVAGEEVGALEGAIQRGLQEFRRVVIDLGGVIRVDSSGIGLLVRCLSHTRNRGGDLRLSAIPPGVADLLRATKLTTVFKVHDSEDEAILSFLKEPAAAGTDATSPGLQVLFVDRSPELGASMRALLNNQGYRALSTCRIHDARLLLVSTKFDYLVLGPDSSPSASAAAADNLKGDAQSATVVELPSNFGEDGSQRAGAELLRIIEAAKTAKA